MFKVLLGYWRRRWREYHKRTRGSLYRRLIFDAIIENTNSYINGHKHRDEFARRHRNLVRSLKTHENRERAESQYNYDLHPGERL